MTNGDSQLVRAIPGFGAVVATGNKLLRVAKVRTITAHFKISTHFARNLCLETPVIVTEQNPWADFHVFLRRSLIDLSPWKDRRSHQLGLTRPASPRHRRKDTLLNGDRRFLPAPGTQI